MDRRLITLIFAGRNRMVMIRRELPRTIRRESDPQVRRIGVPRVLRPYAPATRVRIGRLIVSSHSYAAARRSASTRRPMAHMKPKSSRPTAVTTCCRHLPWALSFR